MSKLIITIIKINQQSIINNLTKLFLVIVQTTLSI